MMAQLDLTSPLGVTLALLPEIVLSAAALVLLLVVAWRHDTESDSRLAGWLSLAGIVLSGAALGGLWANGTTTQGLPFMVALDGFRYAGAAICLLCAAVTVLISIAYLPRERLLAPEYYPLVLMATAGMLFLLGAE